MRESLPTKVLPFVPSPSSVLFEQDIEGSKDSGKIWKEHAMVYEEAQVCL